MTRLLSIILAVSLLFVASCARAPVKQYRIYDPSNYEVTYTKTYHRCTVLASKHRSKIKHNFISLSCSAENEEGSYKGIQLICETGGWEVVAFRDEDYGYAPGSRLVEWQFDDDITKEERWPASSSFAIRPPELNFSFYGFLEKMQNANVLRFKFPNLFSTMTFSFLQSSNVIPLDGDRPAMLDFKDRCLEL